MRHRREIALAAMTGLRRRSQRGAGRMRTLPGMNARDHGFTLVELMTTLVVLGLLASVAVPGYRHVALRANRSEAKTELLQTASALERCFTRYGAFDSPQCAAQVTLPHSSASGRYLIRAMVRSSSDYRLQAVPQGGQADDRECQTLSYDSSGRKGVTNGAEQSAGFCWSR